MINLSVPADHSPVARTMPTPRSAFRGAIERWEGLGQQHPSDQGNYVTCGGERRLVGTMRGVTAATWCRYAGADPCVVTYQTLVWSVTLDVAADIAVSLYHRPWFGTLTWSPLVEIAGDIGWGSGPLRGVRMLQRVVGADADGVVGPRTVAAYDRALETLPMEALVKQLTDARVAFYLSISDPESRDPQVRANYAFREGWLRRAEWYRRENVDWWNHWAFWTPPSTVAIQIADAAPKPRDPFDGGIDDIEAAERVLELFLQRHPQRLAA